MLVGLTSGLRDASLERAPCRLLRCAETFTFSLFGLTVCFSLRVLSGALFFLYAARLFSLRFLLRLEPRSFFFAGAPLGFAFGFAFDARSFRLTLTF